VEASLYQVVHHQERRTHRSAVMLLMVCNWGQALPPIRGAATDKRLTSCLGQIAETSQCPAPSFDVTNCRGSNLPCFALDLTTGQRLGHGVRMITGLSTAFQETS